MNELIRTRDGSRFVVRAMGATDADAVVASFSTLSPASLRTRFFSPVPRLTSAIVADLTAVEPGRRIVLLALTPGGAVAGEARAVRERDDPRTADVAVTIADAWQRRGLGAALLHSLRRAALLEGIDRLGGHVLVENEPAKRLVRAAGARFEFDEPGVLRFTIPLVGQVAVAA